jgi:hypothetical protein
MRTAVALAAAAVSLGCGCTRDVAPPVRVDAVPTVSADECARFAARLPSSLGDGLKRRRTEPADPHVAAYGADPAVVVRCGAPQSRAYTSGDPLYTVNGLAWYAEERPDAVVWSLPKAFLNVQVTMPRRVTGDHLALLTGAARAAQPGG